MGRGYKAVRGFGEGLERVLWGEGALTESTGNPLVRHNVTEHAIFDLPRLHQTVL